MKPIKQTRTYPESGNCFSACIASLLHLPLDEVPEYENDHEQLGTWFDKWQSWLETYNLTLVCLSGKYTYTKGYAIASKANANPNNGDAHAFIIYNGVPIFDPHPSEQPMFSDWDYQYILVQINPALQEVKQ